MSRLDPIKNRRIALEQTALRYMMRRVCGELGPCLSRVWPYRVKVLTLAEKTVASSPLGWIYPCPIMIMCCSSASGLGLVYFMTSPVLIVLSVSLAR